MFQNKVWRSVSLLMAMAFFLTHLSACGLKNKLSTSATIEYYPMNGKTLSSKEYSCVQEINKVRVAENKTPVTPVNGAPREATNLERASNKALGRAGAFLTGTVGMFLLLVAGATHAMQKDDHADFELRMRRCLGLDMAQY